MRILDKGTALLRLGELGFLPETLDRFAESYRKPYGTILVTGPTGSGKSTTLYATLNILNQPDRNIITVEDPVEYRLAGINQVQVHPKAGLTFAAALRSILRSDPDIVLVGEIRDRETAVIAIEAALTGHLVLSTLHTNDAASTPMRLVEMGVEPFLVTSALDCIVAQRLARKLCDKCKEPYSPTEAELAAGRLGWTRSVTGRRCTGPMGCGSCGRTGYRGRFGIHEVMVVTEEMERLILERRSSEDINKTADDAGDAHAAPGRPAQGRARDDVVRGDLPGRRAEHWSPPAHGRSRRFDHSGRYARVQCRSTGVTPVLVNQARRFGETLVDRHVLVRTDLEEALAKAEQSASRFPAVLLERGLVGAKDLPRRSPTSSACGSSTSIDTPLHQDAPTSLIPADVARSHLALAVDFDGPQA